ncbi:GNAT family N-acetyltransferase [Streptomyces kronopolitis]|uniref:GNAT family N-acetyltransferase n=1 Tax=Streptomyces kronopolitis TaxID=1612435 RepID=UPI0036AB2A47
MGVRHHGRRRPARDGPAALPHRRHATLSYLLREDSWGRGYATQAVADMLRHAFTATGLTSIGARHHPDNPASGRVLLKNGFRYRGIRDGWPAYGIHRPGRHQRLRYEIKIG